MPRSYARAKADMKHRYDKVRDYSTDEIQAAIERANPTELQVVVIGASLYHQDHEFVEEICLSLSSSTDEFVRGNAILGFGHLARRFRNIKDCKVKPLIEAALADPSEHVRGQAWSAAEDATHFLGWDVVGFDGFDGIEDIGYVDD